MKSRPDRFFSTSVSREQAKDSGMAAVLILMLAGWLTGDELFYKIAVGVLLMDMVFPMFFYPFAIFWFGLGNLLGAFVPKILLTVVYVAVLLPVALLRQMMGKDPLLLKKFKKGRGSVLKARDHDFGPADLEKPY